MAVTKAQARAAASILAAYRTPARAVAARENGKRGGRPNLYRMRSRCLEKFVDGAWVRLYKPYNRAAREWVNRQRREGADI